MQSRSHWKSAVVPQLFGFATLLVACSDLGESDAAKDTDLAEEMVESMAPEEGASTENAGSAVGEGGAPSPQEEENVGTGGAAIDQGVGGSSPVEVQGAALGEACLVDEDCEMAQCESGVCLTTAQNCALVDVEKAPGNNWSDSYSANGQCYCATTFDHAIGDFEVETPAGMKSVRDVCEALGPGPGIEGNPVYNDIQCGNGPANDAGDEDYCPGLVDRGEAGCCTVGPRWDLSVFEN